MASPVPLWLSVAWRLAPLAFAVAPAPLAAQETVQTLPGITDADRLGEQMRALAANPRDLGALIAAGELSLKLDDLSGAASLFARAEQVDARNPRLKAGEASVLVRSERPGEALRYFAMAQSYGLDPRSFAGDRGLAYDLIGEQERAQRDYRLALRGGADDEVTRRYALSLGISGRRDQALEQLDPLLRKTDRGAWRARAFVLAMAGDVPGAERIATTMMPPGMAAGLQPFFDRLPTLPATDRAFAVHFGEIRATPERIADARLVPAMPALGPDPYAPVVLAKAEPVPASRNDRDDRRRRNRRDKPGRIQLAAAVTTAPAPTLPQPPAYAGQPVQIYTVAPARSAPMNSTARANAQSLATMASTPAIDTSGRAAIRIARREPEQVTPAAVPIRSTPSPVAVAMATTGAVDIPPTSRASPSPSPIRSPIIARAAETTVAMSGPPETMIVPAPSLTTTAPTTMPPPVEVAAVASPAPSPIAGATPAPASSADAPTPAALTAAGDIAPGFSIAATAPTEPPLPRTLARDSADSILARIVAGLSIPASELGVTAVAPARSAPTAAGHVVDEAKAKEARDAAAERLLADRAAAEKIATSRKTAADKRAADKKLAADKQALADKKAADAKKLADAKAAAEEKKAARSNPARLWVQVAGGANESDLPKAWAKVKARAPKGFAGRQGWSTPLRATNRVLAGPFTTDEEARDFVNALAKEGVSAFPFASDKGQPVTKLPAK